MKRYIALMFTSACSIMAMQTEQTTQQAYVQLPKEERDESLARIIEMNDGVELERFIRMNRPNLDNTFEYTWNLDESYIGLTPLTLAAQLGSISAVRTLLMYGANINKLDGKLMTPLHHAVIFYNIYVSGFLLRHGANLEIKAHDGETPLVKMIGYYPTQEMVNFFKEYHAQINLDQHVLPGKRNTLLHRILRYNPDLVKLTFPSLKPFWSKLVNTPNSTGSTPLHVAATYADPAVYLMLLSAGGDRNKADATGQTPQNMIETLYSQVFKPGHRERPVTQEAQQMFM